MLWQLYDQRYPFDDAATTPVELSTKFDELDIDSVMSSSSYPREFASFIVSTLQTRPDDRATAIELLESKWFRKFKLTDRDSAVAALEEWVYPHVVGQTEIRSPVKQMSLDYDEEYSDEFGAELVDDDSEYARGVSDRTYYADDRSGSKYDDDDDEYENERWGDYSHKDSDSRNRRK